MRSLVDRIIKIHGKPGKQVIVKHTLDHGHDIIYYRPVNAESNVKPTKAKLADVEMTITGTLH